jgi:signal transduction histidine kinase
MHQVLSNLLDNAFKFTPRGGRVTVAAQIANGAALCTITDSGSGIPPEIRPHVFERFVQADESRPGRGLGLFITKGLIEAQQGAIWVDSQPGLGTTFSFTVPLAPAPAEPNESMP